MTVPHAFQLGDPMERRGIVVIPLFPRRDPIAVYLTLDEALPRGLRVTETSEAGTSPHSPCTTRSTRTSCSTTARNSLAPNRTGS